MHRLRIKKKLVHKVKKNGLRPQTKSHCYKQKWGRGFVKQGGISKSHSPTNINKNTTTPPKFDSKSLA